jgi:hypothetical protein
LEIGFSALNSEDLLILSDTQKFIRNYPNFPDKDWFEKYIEKNIQNAIYFSKKRERLLNSKK